MTDSPAEEFAASVERLVNQVAHWTPPRWRAASAVSEPADAAPPRAEVFHALVQRIADLAADAEHQPRRQVPRLDNDLALPAQLVVVTRDLLRTHPTRETLDRAHTALSETRTAITP